MGDSGQCRLRLQLQTNILTLIPTPIVKKCMIPTPTPVAKKFMTPTPDLTPPTLTLTPTPVEYVSIDFLKLGLEPESNPVPTPVIKNA